MATKNVVPRANGEGELGTSSKQWKKVNAQQFTGSLGVSASFFEGDGSRLTNVGGGSSFSVTGDVNNRVITADGSSGGVGEANLTFNGSTLGVVGNIDIQGNVTGATNVYVGDKIALRNSTSVDYIKYALGGFYYKGGGTFLGSLNAVQFSASSGTSTFENVSASVNVSASGLYSTDVRTTTAHATTFQGTNVREANGNLEMQIAPGAISILNDLKCGINANPDAFVVDRVPGRVGVNYNLSDLPDAQLSVSGSTKFGIDETHFHQFTGSVNISGALYAGTENPEEHHKFIGTLLVDAAGTNNSELIIDGPNPNWIMLKRNSIQVGKIATDGYNFTIYGGNSSGNVGIAAVHLYDNTQSKALTHFKPSSGISFPGTDSQVNISSSAKALRCDTNSGNNVFTVENATTSFISGSADLITMDNTSVPPTPSNASHIYAKSGEMFVMDAGGNETQISPHDEEGEWQYYSRNVKTGKVVRIRMEKMIRALEDLTGQTFIEEE